MKRADDNNKFCQRALCTQTEINGSIADLKIKINVILLAKSQLKVYKIIIGCVK